MRRLSPSGVRRFLLWFFDEPSNDPYVSLNFDLVIEPALVFLDAFAREHGERVGLQHLVTRAVGRALREVPALNVKITGRAIYALDHVNLAVPVDLGAREGSAGRDETGLIIVRDVDRKSLLEVARDTRRSARAERAGGPGLQSSASFRRLAKRLPPAAMYAGLDLFERGLRVPSVLGLVHERLGASSVVTNVGAVFRLPAGARFRAGAATLSQKAGHMASAFGIGPIEDAAVVEDGVVRPRKVLPLMMIVDHRAVDGVLMATVAERVVSALMNPATLA